MTFFFFGLNSSIFVGIAIGIVVDCSQRSYKDPLRRRTYFKNLQAHNIHFKNYLWTFLWNGTLVVIWTFIYGCEEVVVTFYYHIAHKPALNMRADRTFWTSNIRHKNFRLSAWRLCYPPFYSERGGGLQSSCHRLIFFNYKTLTIFSWFVKKFKFEIWRFFKYLDFLILNFWDFGEKNLN